MKNHMEFDDHQTFEGEFIDEEKIKNIFYFKSGQILDEDVSEVNDLFDRLKKRIENGD